MPTIKVKRDMLQIETDNQQNQVYLKGELSVNSLNDLWSKRQSLFSSIKRVNLAELVRVDSCGLATLVYFCNQYGIKVEGINPQLQTLIELYDLQSVIGA